MRRPILAVLLLAAAPITWTGVFAPLSAHAQDAVYQVGEIVEIEENGRWYSGSILSDEGGGKYKIHFDGYSESYDEVLGTERLRRFGAEAPAPVAAPVPSPAAPKGSPSPYTGSAASSGSSGSAAPVSQDTLAIPVLHPDFRDMALRLGDPVEVIEYGTWYPGVIRNLEYDHKPVTVSMELYETWRWWPFAEVRPMPGYAYAKLPAAVTHGEEGHWKEGDQVEVQVTQWSEFSWKPGVVVSVDGDNYYVHVPDGSGITGQYFVWRQEARVRNPGSDKVGWVANQPDPQGLHGLYQAEASRCPDVGDWPFLWYYDHSFERFVYGVSIYMMTPDQVQGILDGYECLAKARAKYPDLPLFMGADETVEYRYDVQGKFLAHYRRIIEDAVRSNLADQIEPLISKKTRMSGDYVPYGVTKFDGYEEVKAEIVAGGAGYEGMAQAIGMTFEYPWDDIKARYDRAVVEFDAYFHKFSPSLDSVLGYTSPFTTDDPAIEAMATREVLKEYPGATVLSGASNGALLIMLDELDRPLYRYKYVAQLVKHPNYRSCLKIVHRYKEDYSGGGAYGAGQIGLPDATTTSLAEYCPCP